MAAHHEFGASGAKKWMTCPLSAVLEPLEPADDAGAYAEEGTAVHEVAAACVTAGTLAWGYLGQEVNGIEISEEHVTSINDYATLVDELKAEFEGAVFVERQVEYGTAIGHPGAFGTLDCGIVSGDGKSIVIVDRKFKWGYRVDAEQNPQLMLYALGLRQDVLDLYGEAPDLYKLIIHQHLEGPASSWECGNAELLAFADKARDALDMCTRAREDAAALPLEEVARVYGSPSAEACRYCKARATCPALAQTVLGAVTGVAEVDLAAPVEALSSSVVGSGNAMEAYRVEQLAKYASLTELVRLWCNAVDARLNAELHSGNAVPGWKLVQGRKGNRKFKDEAEVETVFRCWGFEDYQIHSHKLKTPAQLEKLVKNDRTKYPAFQELTTQEEGKPKAVPAADPRPAIEAIVFENCEEEL